MTSRIALRKEQQRELPSNAQSIGWVMGSGVIEPVFVQGTVWSDGQKGSEGYFQLPKGSVITRVRVASSGGEAPQTIDVSSEGATVSGLTVGVKRDDTSGSERADINGLTELEPTPARDIDSISVTLESGVRPLVPVAYTIIDTENYRADFDVAPAVFGGKGNRQPIGVYNTLAAAESARVAFLDYNPTAALGSLVSDHNLVLDPLSTKDKEFSSYLSTLGAVFSPASIIAEQSFVEEEEEGQFNLYWLVLYASPRVGRDNWFVSVTAPSRSETRSGTPPDGDAEIIPQNLTVNFQQTDGTTVETQSQVVNAGISGRQTLKFTRAANLTTETPKVVFDLGDHTQWLRDAIIPKAGRIKNPLLDTYPFASNFSEQYPVQIFTEPSPISVPSNATVGSAGQLVYSGAWGGTFKTLGCRCPAWILYAVLTEERFGIRTTASRIDADSFLGASKYCNGLVEGKVRWAFDGILKGTQRQIIDTLLGLMRGWLYEAADGRLTLGVESPDTTKWAICPAVVLGGEFRYREPLDRPAVRCRYTNRLTGRIEVSPGFENDRIEEVAWQDPDVCNRWSNWETFSDQNLLGTVEFGLPWHPYHKVSVGDLIELHDPTAADLRLAGRIIESNSTDNWIRIDGFPFGLYPSETAAAGLLQTNRKAAIDPDLWGFVTSSAIQPTVKVQKPDGGFDTLTVSKVAWAPSGRPDQNRVWVNESIKGDLSRRVFVTVSTDVYPSFWRVQSISEGNGGREFRVVATRWIDGMHNYVEKGAALPSRPTRFMPVCGTKLSQFQCEYDNLTMRYPDPSSGPFDPENTMDGLVTSCV